MQRLGLILFILCLLYLGKSLNSSEANNRGLQTQQCPIGQVAGNPCRGRFNTERTVTWGPFLESPIINGPGKLSPFTLKIEVSIVLHLTR